jgi:muconate cycloisomerase
MRIAQATIFSLKIPFVESFRHSTKDRTFSDSIVVRLLSDDGCVGYGEGVARPYVTGETVESALAYMQQELWPKIAATEFPELKAGSDPLAILGPLELAMGLVESTGIIAWHSAWCAFELALLDCLLIRQQLSLSALLPPKRETVVYSGVITASAEDKTMQIAKYLKLFGLTEVKVKIGAGDDKRRLTAIRKVLGEECSIRVDANGAYSRTEALAVIKELEELHVVSVEQPIPRTTYDELAKLRTSSPIPIMVDESLVTMADAQGLVGGHACDAFNLRISKCGGIHRTLQMAEIATKAGLRVQLGSQVGETAILSAAGRHVAAYLDNPWFVEGSFGKLLLVEDVSELPVQFGHGGKAPLLGGPGLGVKLRDDVLTKYAERVINCKPS